MGEYHVRIFDDDTLYIYLNDAETQQVVVHHGPVSSVTDPEPLKGRPALTKWAKTRIKEHQRQRGIFPPDEIHTFKVKDPKPKA